MPVTSATRRAEQGEVRPLLAGIDPIEKTRKLLRNGNHSISSLIMRSERT